MAVRAPKYLAPATRKWWLEVVRTYELESHHLRLLTAACQAWDRAEQAREILAAQGVTFVDRWGQPKTRPEVAIERDSRIGFARLLRELALDVDAPPESRPPGIL